MPPDSTADGGADASVGELALRLGLVDPLRVGATVAGALRWGPTLASTVGGAALRHPTRSAVIDDDGSISFGELELTSTRTARGLRGAGLAPQGHLGILCRNGRAFVDVLVAAGKVGAVPVLLNTGFAGPQLGDVMAREQVDVLVCDPDFAGVVADSGFDGPVVFTSGDAGQTLADIRKRPGRLGFGRFRPLAPVMLTSGTTGTPKGARRGSALDVSAATGVFKRIPYRTGDVFAIPAPLFHAWGLAQLTVALSLGSTSVVASRFDPRRVLDDVVDHRATVLGVVPVMLQRLLEAEMRKGVKGQLRIVASSGSALPVPVAEEWTARYGETLYNLYGSTEVGQAAIATPADLRDAPGTVGRPVDGTTVAILDAKRRPVASGDTGEIFVGNGAQFDHYTGGGTKESVDGLMSSGDVGHLDQAGRLFVTGRADDMIVSGGENVFPAEVEDVILAMDGVVDAAVVGVDDDEFGQRLAALVVADTGTGTVDADRVRQAVTSTLARYKVPRDVVFADEVPRTTTGKIRRVDVAAVIASA